MFDHLWTWLEKCDSSDGLPNFGCLKSSFDRLPSNSRLDVCRDFFTALQALDTPSIWSLGSLAFGQPLGDDSFKDFRRWLIFQGRTTAEIALNAPDRLSSVLSSRIGDENLFIESLHWLEEPLTLLNFHRQVGARTWTTPDVDTMKLLLPTMFEALGASFAAAPVDIPDSSEMLIDGLGVLKVGDRVRHRASFGMGVIRAIRVAATGVADIEFEGGMKTMRISASFFDRVNGQ